VERVSADRPVPPSGSGRRAPDAAGRHARGVFLFFSNRLGCFGSLVVSLAITVVLLLALGVLRIQ